MKSTKTTRVKKLARALGSWGRSNSCLWAAGDSQASGALRVVDTGNRKTQPMPDLLENLLVVLNPPRLFSCRKRSLPSAKHEDDLTILLFCY